MSTNQHISNDTIVALATPYGIGAIAVIRLSGADAIELAHRFFKPKGKNKTLLSQIFPRNE